MSGVIDQTPAQLLDWTINWAARGLGSDVISSSSWAVTDMNGNPTTDVTLSSPSFTATTATIWVTGGVPGDSIRKASYLVTNSIVTSGGRDMQETVPYICRKYEFI